MLFLNKMKIFYAIILFIGIVYAKHEYYDGHSVFEISVKSADQVKLMNEIAHELGLDVWNHAVPSRPGQVLVPKTEQTKFEERMKSQGIEYKKTVENIKEFIDMETARLAKVSSRSAFNASRTSLPFDRVFTYDQIDAYLDELARVYPEKVTVVNAGKSFEGRNIRYLKISSSNFQDQSKPIIYMESLLHAREWITQSATLYAIHKLVIDVTDLDLIENMDWIILPIANPDGFAYTQDQRFWRKNRATGYMIADLCAGVDLNRNFDYLWSTASSGTVCSDTFHGSHPFSEPETLIIRDIVQEHKHRMAMFMDIHSYGSWILYGYGDGNLPPNSFLLHHIAQTMGDTIDKIKADHNDDYVIGNVEKILYAASGSAMDYAMDQGVPLAYTYELPGYILGSGSALGFLVDPDFIEQAGMETWEGIKSGVRIAVNNYQAKPV